MICPKCGYAGRTGWKEITVTDKTGDNLIRAWVCPVCEQVTADNLAADDEHRENKRHGLDR